MNYFILIFGAFMCVAGFVLLLRPAILFNLLRGYQNSAGLYGLAVVVRLILGIVLILAAPASRFPLTLEILGWIAIVAAVFIGALGTTRFSKLMAWALGLSEGLGRLSGVFALLFGGFLIYAVR